MRIAVLKSIFIFRTLGPKIHHTTESLDDIITLKNKYTFGILKFQYYLCWCRMYFFFLLAYIAHLVKNVTFVRIFFKSWIKLYVVQNELKFGIKGNLKNYVRLFTQLYLPQRRIIIFWKGTNNYKQMTSFLALCGKQYAMS